MSLESQPIPNKLARINARSSSSSVSSGPTSGVSSAASGSKDDVLMTQITDEPLEDEDELIKTPEVSSFPIKSKLRGTGRSHGFPGSRLVRLEELRVGPAAIVFVSVTVFKTVT